MANLAQMQLILPQLSTYALSPIKKSPGHTLTSDLRLGGHVTNVACDFERDSPEMLPLPDRDRQVW